MDAHRIAFVASAVPRRCGIATFTADLTAAVKAADPAVRCVAAAIDEVYLTPERPSVADLHVEVERRVKDINRYREEPLPIPSYRCVTARVRAVLRRTGPHHVHSLNIAPCFEPVGHRIRQKRCESYPMMLSDAPLSEREKMSARKTRACSEQVFDAIRGWIEENVSA